MSEAINLRIDPNDLTLGDLEDFEDYVGKSIFDIIQPMPVLDADGNKVFDEQGRPETEVKMSSKALVALVWITQRTDKPGFTVSDARGVKIAALEIVDVEANEGNG